MTAPNPSAGTQRSAVEALAAHFRDPEGGRAHFVLLSSTGGRHSLRTDLAVETILGWIEEAGYQLVPVASAPPSLDVERLARLFERMEWDCDPDRGMLHSTCDHEEQAERFAAAYSEASAEPKDGGE